MKKMKQWLVAASCLSSGMAFANAVPNTTTVEKVQAAIGPTTAVAQTQNDQVTVTSPRTGITYTFANPEQRQVIFQTQAIAPVNVANVNRIVAANPALSAQSQERAKEALLGTQIQP